MNTTLTLETITDDALATTTGGIGVPSPAEANAYGKYINGKPSTPQPVHTNMYGLDPNGQRPVAPPTFDPVKEPVIGG